MKFLKKIYVYLAFIFLYAPILILMVYSFNNSKSRGVWGGWTLKWYAQMFADTNVVSSLKVTLIVALIAAVIATVIGTVASLGLHFMKGRKRAWIMNITYIPVVQPDIIMGVSLMLLFIFIRVPKGYGTLILAHITFNIPFVILSVLPKLKQLNPHLFEAAEDLGASVWTTLWRVVLPEIKTGVMAGFLLAITLSLDDFVVSYFVSGAGVNTLSVTIYAMARKGISPSINALSTILFVVVMVMLIVVNRKPKSSSR